MSRAKSQSFGSVRREIARRLKAKLPLAGMIAATSLLCGCEEQPSRGKLAGVPVPPPNQSEQKSERPAPNTPTPPEKNGKCEVKERHLVGMPKPPPNEKNESSPEIRLSGAIILDK